MFNYNMEVTNRWHTHRKGVSAEIHDCDNGEGREIVFSDASLPKWKVRFEGDSVFVHNEKGEFIGGKQLDSEIIWFHPDYTNWIRVNVMMFFLSE